MLFETLPADAVTPDPIASPGEVPSSHILQVPSHLPKSDEPVAGVLLGALPATAAPTVEVYVEVERTTEPFLNERPALAERRWLLWRTATAITAGELGELVARVPAGNVYLRVTVAVPGAELLVGWV